MIPAKRTAFFRLCMVCSIVIPLVLICSSAPSLSLDDRSAFGLKAGYGTSFDTEEDITFISVLPYYEYRYYRLGTPDNVALDFHFVLEGAINIYTDPEWGEGLGLIPMLRFDLENRYVVPYIGLGIGPYYFHLDVVELGQAWNFLSQAELGIRFNCFQNLGWHVSYRIQHVSNAGMSDRNSGVDSHLFLVGVSYRF